MSAPNTGIPESSLRYVSAPIATDNLREYFTNKEIFFVVNYSESKLKGAAFLTYITNLNIPCDVKFNMPMAYEEYLEIMQAYMEQTSVVAASGLHVMMAEMLLLAKGLPYVESPYALPIDEEIVRRFITEQRPAIDKWLHFIDSTQVFALSAISVLNAHYKPKERFPIVDDKDYVGRNVAYLFAIPDFIAIYFSLPNVAYKLSYFLHQFEEYMFKDERLAKYFGSRNNMAALMFQHMAAGLFRGEEIGIGIFGVGVFDPQSEFYVPEPYLADKTVQVGP